MISSVEYEGHEREGGGDMQGGVVVSDRVSCGVEIQTERIQITFKEKLKQIWTLGVSDSRLRGERGHSSN